MDLLSVGRFFAVVVKSGNAHLLQPLLDHLVNESVVTNEASLVLRGVLTLGTFVDLALLNSLAKTLPEMTVSLKSMS
jgi:hypothetical protein